MNLFKKATILALPLVVVSSSLPAEAQLPGALERQARRGARQLQRQINRADYYTNQSWQQLNPWIQQYGVTPLGRTANAVRQTVDAATRIGDGQYGYRDQSAPNAWFYDYYSYSPTYYTTPSNNRYASAIRYYDPDGDGVFDSRARYRDSDDDGRYDEYDRYDFYSADAVEGRSAETDRARTRVEAESQNQNDSNRYVGPEDARQYTVSGQIKQTKMAQVNGNKNLIVAVTTDNNKSQPIDLGPADGMQGKGFEVGTSITATGAMESIGDKNLLIAERVQIDGGSAMEINRQSGDEWTGEIVSVKTTKVDSSNHYLAVVDVDGERQLVDMGPTDQYKAEIEPSTKVTVRGIPVRSGNYRVLMANRVNLAGQTITLNRLQ
ncbi:hypothetical protein FYK55_15030 [Roseiconus nitratireducens]|uniref:DUF5666 domain-containing protein n=1 Tax=Roseiconus nitratireducens TaxID=2605748 RepID=A0A5M6D6D3_9BACT|nr:hypothetical protein [Roseiconus nitratireducens]KAA5542120.1 hypothetical protein FYK55_15030 [Roseiconus nitratireducens]